MLRFRRGEGGGPGCQELCARYSEHGFELPMRLAQESSPFYLLQVAYWAKCGRPVGT